MRGGGVSAEGVDGEGLLIVALGVVQIKARSSEPGALEVGLACLLRAIRLFEMKTKALWRDVSASFSVC